MQHGRQNWPIFKYFREKAFFWTKYMSTISFICRIIRLQDRAIRVINFAHNYESRNPLYTKSKILKFADNIKLLNFLYVYDSIKGNLPSSLNHTFKAVPLVHTYTSIHPKPSNVTQGKNTSIWTEQHKI